MPAVVTIKIRGGTAAAWTLANPILALREMGIETNTKKFKFGDGVTAWDSLGYAVGDGTATWGSITGTLTSQGDLTAYITAQLAALVDSSPSTLDTLNELANALGDDPNFATTITNLIADKAPKQSVDASGTAISFAVPQTYGSEASPETANVTFVSAGLVKGIVQLLLHNNSSEPTWPTQFKRIGGAYFPGVLNSIYMHAVSSTRIEYTISQEL